jgi:hypothetical protein
MNLPEDTRSVVRPSLPAASTAAPRTALQLRAERMLARALPQLRYQLMRAGPAGLTGVAVLMAAAVSAIALLVPAHQSVLQLRTELTRAGHAAQAPSQPEQSPQQFAAALPTREQIPALLGVVLVQATESGVVLEQGKYTFTPSTATRLARYTFEFPVKADYGKIRTFIDKSLAALPALGLDKLHVERKNVGDTLVSADVSFVIYLRGA